MCILCVRWSGSKLQIIVHFWSSFHKKIDIVFLPTFFHKNIIFICNLIASIIYSSSVILKILKKKKPKNSLQNATKRIHHLWSKFANGQKICRRSCTKWRSAIFSGRGRHFFGSNDIFLKNFPYQPFFPFEILVHLSAVSLEVTEIIFTSH